jgi:hypothetical protein
VTVWMARSAREAPRKTQMSPVRVSSTASDNDRDAGDVRDTTRE